MDIKAKKSLGQHFLKDISISKQIVDSFNTTLPFPKTILEIGPGKGALTQFLIEREINNLFLIEIDQQLTNYLANAYPLLTHNIVTENFLNLNLSKKFPGTIGIIGNFPYNLSSLILFQLLKYRDQVQEIVCMLQKEVAERIVSQPGSKVYGIPSVLLQAFYNVEYLFTVEPNVFSPPPKVHSAVIRLRRNDIERLSCDENLFFKLVKRGFQQRRKKLKNALNFYTERFTTEFPLLNQRAEELSVQQFITLTEHTSDICKMLEVV